MPPTILHVMLEARMGGPQLRVLALAEALRPLGIETRVVLPEGAAPFAPYLLDRGFPVDRLPLERLRASRDPRIQLRSLSRFVPGVQKLVRIIRAASPDIVHVHGLYQPQGAIAGRLADRPVVWHLNDLLLPPAVAHLAAPIVLRLSQAAITVSWAVRRYVFGTQAHADRVVTIYDAPVRVGQSSLGMPIEPGAAGPLELPGMAPRLLTVGNLYGIKGHADLLDALLLLRAPATLLLVGAPLDTQPEVAAALEQRCMHPLLQARVKRIGWQEEVAPWYAGCDLYVHPSHSEACPLAVLEAMAAGRAVVATAVGGVPELVVSGGVAIEHPEETGLLVPPRDPPALARAIDALLADPLRRARMGERARARVARYFSLDRCARRHAALYRAVMDGCSPADALSDLDERMS